MEILRDSIWQFILGMASIILAIVIYQFQRQVKELKYEILNDISLISVNEGIKKHVQVLYQGTPTDDLSFVRVKIINSGNIPIRKKDFEEYPTLILNKGATILNAEIEETFPENIINNIDIDDDNITIPPILLNSGDWVVVILWVANFKGSVELRARIVGAKVSKKVSRKSRSLLYSLLLLCQFILFTYILPYIAGKPIDNTLRLSFIIALLLNIILIMSQPFTQVRLWVTTFMVLGTIVLISFFQYFGVFGFGN